eukprot:m.1833 g.1833  ORF g.1833 m.1833 type:complete len:65 (+) comp1159_c0_seq1:126-320(+)
MRSIDWKQEAMLKAAGTTGGRKRHNDGSGAIGSSAAMMAPLPAQQHINRHHRPSPLSMPPDLVR